MSKSRNELLLEKLLNGETADIVPRSRVEKILKAMIDGEEITDAPQSRLEAYLMAVAANGGGDIDALIDGSLTEITSNALYVAWYTFYYNIKIVSAVFPKATGVGQYAFQNCSKLMSVSFPNASQIEQWGFANCTSLKSVSFPSLTKSSNYMFNGCTNLIEVDVPLLKAVSKGDFQNCSALKRIIIPNATYAMGSAFSNCTLLVFVDLPKISTFIDGYQFSSDYSFKSLVLRSETMCTLANKNAFNNCYHFHGTVNATYNPDGLKDGYIYVPRALIEDYKVATNWVTFADQFRALEDYTVDGTTTGELDESKVSL